MAEEHILINGDRYISSGRAAKLVGYTKDYVGQLARDGKIGAKRVGRNWYIEESSINKHKLSVHYTLTKPKKKREDGDEIAIHNIDNSAVRKEHDLSIKKFVGTNPPVSQVAVRVDVPQNKNEEKVDLFPQPRKKNRDPLLHSDIRFESVNQTQNPIGKKEGIQKVEEKHTFKQVPIRKPAPRFIEDVKPKKPKIQSYTGKIGGLRKHPTIDGIIMSPKPSPYYERRKFTRELDSGGLKEILKMEESEESVYVEEQDSSKMVPVIGAIVIFTVFVVAYIFLTGGKI